MLGMSVWTVFRHTRSRCRIRKLEESKVSQARSPIPTKSSVSPQKEQRRAATTAISGRQILVVDGSHSLVPAKSAGKFPAIAGIAYRAPRWTLQSALLGVALLKYGVTVPEALSFPRECPLLWQWKWCCTIRKDVAISCCQDLRR